MTSKVDICNLALANIGADYIQSLSEDSREAKECNRFYDLTRRMLLQASHWTFASKRQGLAELTNDWEERYGYKYSLPSDMIKLRRVIPAADPLYDRASVPYEIKGQSLYCDISPCSVEYTYELDDSTQFPYLFIQALARQLSAQIAMPITRDNTILKNAIDLADMAVRKAIEADANQETHRPDYQAEWINARDGVGSSDDLRADVFARID